MFGHGRQPRTRAVPPLLRIGRTLHIVPNDAVAYRRSLAALGSKSLLEIHYRRWISSCDTAF